MGQPSAPRVEIENETSEKIFLSVKNDGESGPGKKET